MNFKLSPEDWIVFWECHRRWLKCLANNKCSGVSGLVLFLHVHSWYNTHCMLYNAWGAVEGISVFAHCDAWVCVCVCVCVCVSVGDIPMMRQYQHTECWTANCSQNNRASWELSGGIFIGWAEQSNIHSNLQVIKVRKLCYSHGSKFTVYHLCSGAQWPRSLHLEKWHCQGCLLTNQSSRLCQKLLWMCFKFIHLESLSPLVVACSLKTAYITLPSVPMTCAENKSGPSHLSDECVCLLSDMFNAWHKEHRRWMRCKDDANLMSKSSPSCGVNLNKAT